MSKRVRECLRKPVESFSYPFPRDFLMGEQYVQSCDLFHMFLVTRFYL